MTTGSRYDESGGASTRVLAELARAGSSLLLQPNNQVGVEVHHILDRPGYLSDILTRIPRPANRSAAQSPVWLSPFTETLTASAYGAGLVIGIRTLPIGPDTGEGIPDAGAQEVEPTPHSDRVCYGMAVPNLAFSFDSGSRFEGLISVETEPNAPEHSHARALLLVIQEIAQVAVNIAKAPILYLQSPVQLPESTPPRDERMNPLHAAAAWSIAVRFGIALSPPTAALRLQIAHAFAGYCAERGFGLWLADGRPGYRPGNWFQVCQHDRSRGSAFVSKIRSRTRSGPVTAQVPFTLIGPARTGAVRAVSTFLKDVPEVGVAACSTTTIHDLDFIHLQLTSDALATVGERLNAALASEHMPSTDPRRLLRLVVAELCPDGEQALPQQDNLGAGTAGYQAFAGPVQALRPDDGAGRVALWVSWQLGGRTADFAQPFLSLYEALRDVRLVRTGDGEVLPPAARPNVEYLICRRVRQSIHGKGKISLPKEAFFRHRDLASLAERIEDAWALQLGPAHPTRKLTVSFWEYWLGHWASPI